MYQRLYAEMKITDADYQRLKNYMYQNFGINLEGKKVLIEGRLNAVLRKHGFNNFNDYIDFLLRDKTGSEVSTLVSRLTTNYTYFMREQGHYDFTKKVALPKLCPTIKNKDLRIWSAACSSGEEPYSIAMMLDQYFGVGKDQWDKVVLASDISDNVLRTATKGIYPKERISMLSDSEIKTYFRKEDEKNYRVTPYLRSQVAFRKINLMDPFSFKKKFHIIFCRNVMIYFDNQTKERLLDKFYDILVPGGYLYIGLSESVLSLKTKFKYVEPAIYTKLQ